MAENNFAARVDLSNPHGFPLRLRVVIIGYALTAGSTGRVLIRGPGNSSTALLDSAAFSSVDLVENSISIYVPPADPGYSQVIEGKPYRWSLDVDTDAFRIQGNYKSVYDVGPFSSNDGDLTVHLGEIVVKVYASAGGGASVQSGGHLELGYDFSQLTSVLSIGTILAGFKIFKSQLDIIDPFDNNTSFSVGTDSDPAAVLELSAADSAIIEDYHSTLNLSITDELKLFPYYVTQPTAGSAIVTIYYL